MVLNKRPEKTKRLLWRKIGWPSVIILALLIAGGVAAYAYWGTQTSVSTAGKTPAYYTTRVSRGSILISALGSGILVADPQINLAFSTAGRVGQLKVKVGDEVKSGATLAQLDNLGKLQASIASSELAVIQAQQALDAVSKNAPVNLATAFQTWTDASTAYNDAQSAELRTAYTRCSKDLNTKYLLAFQNARENVNKLTLSAPGSDALITAQNDFDTASANYTYCSAYTQDETTSAKANTAITKLKTDQARTNYELLNTHNGVDPQSLQSAQANLKQAQLQLTQYQTNLAGATLTAPIDGTIISISANQGEVVDTSTFIVLADLSQSRIQVQISEADMNKMALDNKAEIVFDAVPKQTFTGKITRINPALTTSGETTVVTGVIALDQTPLNPANNHLLPLGLNCNVTVINAEASDVLMVPLEALRDLGDGSYGVFVLGKDQKLNLQTVQIGLKNSVYVEIKSGLNAGDTVSTGTTKTA